MQVINCKYVVREVENGLTCALTKGVDWRVKEGSRALLIHSVKEAKETRRPYSAQWPGCDNLKMSWSIQKPQKNILCEIRTKESNSNRSNE